MIKKNILIGPLPPPLNGQCIAFKMLCDGYGNRQIPHTVIDISPGDKERKDGGYTFSRFFSLLRPFLRALLFPFLSKRTVYLTIAQSWSGFLRDFVFITLAWIGKHRIILHFHGGGYDRFFNTQAQVRQKIIIWTLARAEKIIVLGENLKGLFNFVPNHEKKVIVVMNGLPFDSPQNQTIPKSLPGGNAPLRLVFLSNLIEFKGYLLLLEAVRILMHQHDINVTCEFCGDFLVTLDSERYTCANEARQDFLDRVRDYGLEKNIHWKGVVSGADKLKVLERAHFFVLPSTNEGQPLSIIEALAMGCVVISTKQPLIPEMLAHGDAGLLLESVTAEAIAETVRTVYLNPRRFEKLSGDAYLHYKKLFTREAHLNRLTTLLETP